MIPQQQQPYTNVNMGFPNSQQSFPQQNSYGQQIPFKYGMQPQGQYGMMGGYQQPNMQQPNMQQGLYNPQYQQPMHNGGLNMGYNATNLSFNQAPQYQQPAMSTFFINSDYGQQQQMYGGNVSLTTKTQTPAQKNLSGISLQTTNHSKKDEDEFGNFSSGQNNNVKWLSNDEKGLIDFSDFSEQLKNGGNKSQPKNTANSGNNIDTTWTW